MCLLFETIKILEGEIYNLEFHQKRVDKSGNILDLSKIINIPDDNKTGLFKCKIIYSRELKSISFEPYNIRKIRNIKIVHDDEINYSKKYLNRKNIENLLEQNKNYDDILIIKNGFVTDSSKANIVFFDGGKWITPTSPLLEGTQREKLLKNKIITKQEIKIENIKSMKYFMLINAMNEFNPENSCDISIISF
jgi:4-amino-4-deoxychorismate lyase